MLQAIAPKGDIVNSQAVVQAVLEAMNGTCQQMLTDFRGTTRTWDHDVLFYRVPAHTEGSNAVAAAGTDDEIYGYVTHGTREHTIMASNAKALAFPEGYTPKTSKGDKGVQDGAVAGGGFGGFVFAQSVNHPGISPRRFEEAIEQKYEEIFSDTIQEAITGATGV